MSDAIERLKAAGIFADWEYWNQIPQVMVAEAVALSSGLEPRIWIYENGKPLDVYRVSHRAYSDSRFVPLVGDNEAIALLMQFYERLNPLVEIAAGNLIENGGELKARSYLWRDGGIASRVSVSAFGAWAKSKGWDLPDEFPIHEFQVKKDENTMQQKEAFEALLGVSLCNPGGNHAMQEQYILDEMKRRKLPDFMSVADGEAASLQRFFVNHNLMSESVARAAWGRLVAAKRAGGKKKYTKKAV
jgi:hypothetical protein